MKKNKHKIDWRTFSLNSNGIELLEENKDKIRWFELCQNPNAISLLKKNQDKIDWRLLSYNPAIFTKINNYEIIIKPAINNKEIYICELFNEFIVIMIIINITLIYNKLWNCWIG